MTGADGFKHISVTPEEDEDVVILAGAKKLEDDSPVDDAAIAPVDDAPSTASEDVRPNAEKSKARPTQEKSDDFRETTLEDLQSAPMSTMQKAIIVIAALTIVIAVVYYMMFMR